MTGSDEYNFGDLTKEIVRRVASGSYTLDDLFMLLKAMSLVGASLSPVAGFLPVKLLVELLNFSLMNDIAGKVTSSLAIELDKRLKKSLLGDEDYTRSVLSFYLILCFQNSRRRVSIKGNISSRP